MNLSSTTRVNRIDRLVEGNIEVFYNKKDIVIEPRIISVMVSSNTYSISWIHNGAIEPVLID